MTSVPGLSRATQLRLLGNSAIPAQVAYALAQLLHPPELVHTPVTTTASQAAVPRDVTPAAPRPRSAP
ncbi:hypothetical protein [Streptomyces sp. NPDC050738]|uniref:hypothetical protein n=1 Tax=Streptomyces sp. NPDC050738 TaxID=3154744 RepID=UPI00343727EC